MPHGTLGGSLGTWRYDAYSAARFASRSRYCFGLQAGRIRESRATVADNAAWRRLGAFIESRGYYWLLTHWKLRRMERD